MATVEHITLVCDLCRHEGESVHTHSLTVDGKTVELEVCNREWGQFDRHLAKFMRKGRKQRRSTTKRRLAAVG